MVAWKKGKNSISIYIEVFQGQKMTSTSCYNTHMKANEPVMVENVHIKCTFCNKNVFFKNVFGGKCCNMIHNNNQFDTIHCGRAIRFCTLYGKNKLISLEII